MQGKDKLFIDLKKISNLITDKDLKSNVDRQIASIHELITYLVMWMPQCEKPGVMKIIQGFLQSLDAKLIDFWRVISSNEVDVLLCQKILRKIDKYLREIKFNLRIEDIPEKGNFGNDSIEGESDFLSFRKQSRIIDKSLFIKELIEDKAPIKVITRPRRFGKTLNLSMVRYFFDVNKKEEVEKQKIFDGLQITNSENKKYFSSHHGKYPVINLSFKDTRANSFEYFLKKFRNLIGAAYSEHKQKVRKILQNEEIEFYESICDTTKAIDSMLLEKSLQELMEYLTKAYGGKCVVLIDEYDAPIISSLSIGVNNMNFYMELIRFLSGFIKSALKDNDQCLEMAVIVGILRVSRGNVLSELNNFNLYSVLSDEYSTCFGVTHTELEKLFISFSTNEFLQDTEYWYGGYQIGRQTTVCSTWSIVKVAQGITENKSIFPKIFKEQWVDAGDNSIINTLMIKYKDQLQNDVHKLIENKTIRKKIDEHITFDSIFDGSENVWTFLVLIGCLTFVANSYNAQGYLLTIPNKELHTFFISNLSQWGYESIYKIPDFQNQNMAHTMRLIAKRKEKIMNGNAAQEIQAAKHLINLNLSNMTDIQSLDNAKLFKKLLKLHSHGSQMVINCLSSLINKNYKFNDTLFLRIYLNLCDSYNKQIYKYSNISLMDSGKFTINSGDKTILSVFKNINACQAISELSNKQKYLEAFASITTNNLAVQAFLGKSIISKSSHLEFKSWYHPDICDYLLQLIPNKAKCIRVMFADAGYGNNTQTFKDQLLQLVLLGNLLQRPSIFISKEPGADIHFICGLINNDKLLLINPLGISTHSDCYNTLSELKKEKTISEVWFSSNKLQKHSYEEEGLVSCGPITLELAMHIVSQFTAQALNNFWNQLKINEPITHEKSRLTYHGLNISELLPETLKKLVQVSNEADYQKQVCAIRKKHLQKLKNLPAEQATDDYLNGCKGNAPAQVLFNALITREKTINTVTELNEYALFKKEMEQKEALNDSSFNNDFKTYDFTNQKKKTVIAEIKMFELIINCSMHVLIKIFSFLEKRIKLIREEKFKEQVQQALKQVQKVAPMLNDLLIIVEATTQVVLQQMQCLSKLIISKINFISDEASNINSELQGIDILRMLLDELLLLEKQLKPAVIQNITPKLISGIKLRHSQEQYIKNKTGSLLPKLLECLSNVEEFAASNFVPNKVFIYYAWASEAHPEDKWIQEQCLVQLCNHLRKAGIHTSLDRVDNIGGNNIYQFIDKIEAADKVILIGTPSLLEKHKLGTTAVCNELILIGRKRKEQQHAVLPILISGDFETSFPPYFTMYTTIRDWSAGNYIQCLKRLIQDIYEIGPDDNNYKKLWLELEEIDQQQTRNIQNLPEVDAEKIDKVRQAGLSLKITSPPNFRQAVVNEGSSPLHGKTEVVIAKQNNTQDPKPGHSL